MGRNDRLAIVLANGPEMASCFISAACGVATAPLNPAYRADEFEFYPVSYTHLDVYKRQAQGRP